MVAVVRDRRPLPEQLRGPLSHVPASRQLPAAEDDPAPDIRILRDGLRRTRRGIPPIRTISGQVRELSSGEVRIAGIWLVLCSPAPFCILDEPFSFLAPVAVERIQDLIRRQKSSKGIILSDHNYTALLEVSDEVLLLSDGYVHQVRDRSDLVRYGYCRQ